MQECTYAYMHTAEIWKKYNRFFLFPESIFIIKLGLIFHIILVFFVRISFID